MPVSVEEYRKLRDRIDAYEATRKRLFPGKCSLGPDDREKILKASGVDREPTNEDRGQVEIFEFIANPPDRYFAYVKEEGMSGGRISTWMGDALSNHSHLGREFRDNFGGSRRSVWFRAINGRAYCGTFYKSAGDYCRVRLCKE